MKNVFITLLLCLLLAGLFFRCEPIFTPPPSVTQEKSSVHASLPPLSSGEVKATEVVPDSATESPTVKAIFSTPIIFYGRVQTQNGAPVAGAQVTAAVANKFGGGSSRITVESDSQGHFSISAVGMTVSIRVSKDGYFPIPDKSASEPRSSGAFDYGADLGNGIHKPDPNTPVIFTLFAPPIIEPLIRIREKEIVMPKNGEPMRISLDIPAHILELRFWSSDSAKERDGRFDWKLEVSAIGGSLQRRHDSFDFTAPTDGYEPADLIHAPRTLKRPEWQDDLEQSYWIRFNDGTFGFINVRMIAGGAHYAIVSGYTNPKKGSRNLAIPPKRR